MISFACFSPHPPLLLPDIGSIEDREKVKKTIEKLEFLGKKLNEAKPDAIIISSPHPDWGFNVPLYFLAPDFLPAVASPARNDAAIASGPQAMQAGKGEIKTFLTDLESPASWFEKGKKLFSYSRELADNTKNYALIASGDMSHCLKEDGPYGFHSDGPKFDKALVEYLRKKDIKKFLKLNEMYPKADECGLRSFSFVLGILEASGLSWKPEILSYESPFGVGYSVVNFKLEV